MIREEEIREEKKREKRGCGCRLLVVGWRVLGVGCWLLVVGCWLLVGVGEMRRVRFKEREVRLDRKNAK